MVNLRYIWSQSGCPKVVISGLTSGCYLVWILKEVQQIGDTERHQHIVTQGPPSPQHIVSPKDSQGPTQG